MKTKNQIKRMRRNRMVKPFFLIVTTLLLFGCEQETYLFVNEENISFEEAGGSKSLEVVANKDWRINSSAAWCKLSPSAGEGNNKSITVMVNCDANAGYDERNCSLTIQCDDVVKTVTVVQSPKDAVIIDKVDYDLTYEEQTLSISVLENTSYKVQVNADCQDWIHYQGTKGLETSSFNLTIDENEKTVREGVVYVTYSSDIIALKIKQADGTINKNILDAAFKQYCIENFDANKDGLLSHKESRSVTTIDVNTANISSLEGIEYFQNLKTLFCDLKWNYSYIDTDGRRRFFLDNVEVFSKLTTLDVSKNTALRVLKCHSNDLSKLDVLKNTALTYLDCSYNQLTKLDVSKNTALEDLLCSENYLTSLEMSKNTALTKLNCGGNQLTTLDVSKSIALTRLYCYGNHLTTLDVSKNIALTRLDCDGNQLTTLDVSKNMALTDLYCCGNHLTTLDVSKNTALTYLGCYDNQLTTLDVSKNIALTRLDCYSNQLTTLDVSKNTALIYLVCYDNQLTTLDVSKNTVLTYLDCYSNQLTTLNVSKTTTLTYLSCNNNQLATLDVSNYIALTELHCSNNLLTSLDVSKNKALKTLYCYNRTMTDLYLAIGQTFENSDWYPGTTVHYK